MPETVVINTEPTAQVNILRVDTAEIARLARATLTMTPKFFCSGTGWQGFSELANYVLNIQTTHNTCIECGRECWKYSSLTGLGDCLAVSLGNCLVHLAKGTKIATAKRCPQSFFGRHYMTPEEINELKEEDLFHFLSIAFGESIMYGAAAFASGTIWQPVVNTMKAIIESLIPIFSALSMPGVACLVNGIGTGLACGLAFLCAIIAVRLVIGIFWKKPVSSPAGLITIQPIIPAINWQSWTWPTHNEDLVTSLWLVAMATGMFVLTVYFPVFHSMDLVTRILACGGLITVQGAVGAQLVSIAREIVKPAIYNMALYLGCWTEETGFKVRSCIKEKCCSCKDCYSIGQYISRLSLMGGVGPERVSLLPRQRYNISVTSL